jgi:hypothetical protein
VQMCVYANMQIDVRMCKCADVQIEKLLLTLLTLFARSEERVDQRSVVGVSNRRNALAVMSLH